MASLTHTWLRFADSISPLTWLVIRGYTGWIFFSSGKTKLNDWGNTLFLFEHEYNVPALPHTWAAYGATAVELICPVLLWLGLATRFAVAPLLVLVAVIEFTYQSHTTHIYWALLLFAILTHGPDKWSLDHKIWRRG